MTNRRVWLVSGGVVLAAVLFGLGVLLGVVIGDDGPETMDGAAIARSAAADEAAPDSQRGDEATQDRSDPGAGRDVRRLEGFVGPLLERFLDGLGERLSEEGGGGDDPRRPGRFGILPRDLDLPDVEIPGEVREFGACIGEGVADLLTDDDRPLAESARRLWELCTS